MNNKAMLRRLLNVREAAIYLGISQSTVNVLMRKGTLKPVAIPRLDRVLFDQEDLDQMIEESKIKIKE